jgi:hypothetical protein
MSAIWQDCESPARHVIAARHPTHNRDRHDSG